MSVTNASPPKNFLKVVNPILRTLLKSPLAGVTPKHLVILRFAGRKSGRQYEIVIGWHQIDGQNLVFSPYRWTVNFDGGAPVEVIRGSSRRSGSGTLVRDPELVAPKFGQAIDEAGDRNLGVKVSDNDAITPDVVRALERKMIVLDV